MTRDPAPPNLNDPASWNRYSYAGGDPINNVDRDGRRPAQVGCDEYEGCIGDTIGTVWQIFVPTTISFTWFENGDRHDSERTIFQAMNIVRWGNLGPRPADAGAIGIEPVAFIIPFRPECEPAVIRAMGNAWAATTNGTSGKEAGFSLVGPGNQQYSIVPTGAFSSDQLCNANISFERGSTLAIFHVHPNSCEPNPSGTDKDASRLIGAPIYTFGRQGLYVTDPKAPNGWRKVRDGMDWLNPCGDQIATGAPAGGPSRRPGGLFL
jgi:hypothetical protein